MIYQITGAMIAGAISSLIMTRVMTRRWMDYLDKIEKTHMDEILKAVQESIGKLDKNIFHNQ